MQPYRTDLNLRAVTAEEVERSERANNIILRGLQEPPEGDETNILADVLGVPASMVLSMERLGRDQTTTKPVAAGAIEPKHRTVRVMFARGARKNEVYRRLFDLKADNAPLYVGHDLTRIITDPAHKDGPSVQETAGAGHTVLHAI